MITFTLKCAGFGVGYLYPTYSALKLLDRKVIGPEDVTLWLTYFIVAFSLVIGESIGLVSWYVLILRCTTRSRAREGGTRRTNAREGKMMENSTRPRRFQTRRATNERNPSNDRRETDDAFRSHRIPAYRMLKILFCAWMVNPRFKGAITVYKKGIQPVFHQLSPSIDKHTENLKKGDFAAIQQELGPQFARVQELVKKHGPEAIEKALNLAGKGGDKKKPEANGKAE